MIGTRIKCIREREAQRPRSRTPSTLCTQRPGFRKDPGLLVFWLQSACASAQTARSMDRTTGFRWTLFNNLPRDDLGTGRWFRLAFADVAQQAERDHAMVEATSSRLVIRSTSGVSMHSVPRDMVLAVRDVRDLWPGHVQRDTTSDGMLAFGHSRSGRTTSRSSRRPRTPLFQGGYAGSNPARDTKTQELSSTSRFESGNRPQRLGGAGTRDRMERASLTQRPECRPV